MGRPGAPASVRGDRRRAGCTRLGLPHPHARAAGCRLV